MSNTHSGRTLPYIAKRSAPLLVAAAALGLPAGTAHATDGYFMNGVGAKAKGMAGVAIALPQDALAIASNPAAATELGHRVDGGIEIFISNRKASIHDNDYGADARYSGNGSNPFLLPEIGYVRPLSDRVSVGVAIYGNGGMNTDYKEANPFARFGATGRAGVDFKQIFITPTIAAKLLPGHSIGVSPIAVLQGFRAYGIGPFSAYSADADHFSNKGTDWALGGGFRVGYLGHFGDRLSVGAFYQSKVWTGRFDKYAGLFAEQGGFDVPASWGGGAAIKVTDALTIAGDIKRIEYSDVKSVGTPLTQTQFGADNGPGFGWRDVTVYKAGVTYTASPKWTLRAGYGRSGNPIPASQTLLNILAPGIVHDHYTAGATWTSPSGLEVTGYVMHAPKNVLKGNGSIPPGAFPEGFGGGEADLSLGENAVGLSIGAKF